VDLLIRNQGLRGSQRRRVWRRKRTSRTGNLVCG